MTINIKHWDKREEPWAMWHCEFCKPIKTRSVGEARADGVPVAVYMNPPACPYLYVREVYTKFYKRIEYNKDDIGHVDFCPFCSVKNGSIHHVGCMLDRCPKCHEYFQTCKDRITLYFKSPKDKYGGFFVTSLDPILCEICKVPKEQSSFQINVELSTDLETLALEKIL